MDPLRSLAAIGALALSLCLSACASAPLDDAVGVVSGVEVPAARNDSGGVFLPVPHIRQEPGLCVPTAAAMVMAYYGDSRSPRELKALSRRAAYSPGAQFDDFSATRWQDLVAAIYWIGYVWRGDVYSSDSAGFFGGLAKIKESLRAGRPVLVDVALYRTHTFVVVGFDEDANQILIRDPNLESPGLRA